MSGHSDLAARVADRLRPVPGPWDVFAERSRRYEVHLNGPRVELVRGPIVLEGYGVRLLRTQHEKTGVGYQASSDFSEDGVRATVADAETIARFSEFPAKHPELPGGGPAPTSSAAIVDPALWANPSETLGSYVASLISEFEKKKGAVPSFGSVKATLVDTSLANSAGFESGYSHTLVETEVAVKAFGGPEGRPPGEYWFTGYGRRLQPELLPAQTADWARFAEDARHAKSPPNGELPVILPAEVLDGILPAVLRFQFSSAARLRGLAVERGAQVGTDDLDISDDGTLDWGTGSTPFDDEGSPQTRRTLVSSGKVADLLCDVLYGDALDTSTTGSGMRVGGDMLMGGPGRRFTRVPVPASSTLVLPAGKDGSDEELIQQAQDGIWVQQIGWAQPEPLSGRFGGEIRIGYRIRGGKLAEPVRGGTVGGVVVDRAGGPSLLRNIAGRGSRTAMSGGLTSPTLLVRTLSVAGEERPATTASA
jgi:predicted Zn-dependent protease